MPDNEIPAATDGKPQAAEVASVGEIAENAARAQAPAAPAPGPGMPLELPDLSVQGAAGAAGSIDLLMDVNLEIKIELGRTTMAIEDILKLKKGAVVQLDKLAGDPVDILVNGRPVARGEILVVNDNFCVRVVDIIDPEAGLKAAEKDE